LEKFSAALERITVDDLPLYAVGMRQPDHRRSIEGAALIARQAGIEEAVEAARTAVTEYIARQHSSATLRLSYAFEAAAPSGRPEDWVRVMRSVGDAVVALVLWDRLDDHDRWELLGEWARLLP
jgi:hypothetical protein